MPDGPPMGIADCVGGTRAEAPRAATAGDGVTHERLRRARPSERL